MIVFNPHHRGLVIAAAVATAIFLVDCNVERNITVSVLYIVAVWIVHATHRRSVVLVAAAVCSVLTPLGWYFSPGDAVWTDAIWNRVLSLLAIWITAALCSRALSLDAQRNASNVLGEHLQQELNSEHTRFTEIQERCQLTIDAALDAVIMINQHSQITEWNKQAECTFGWSREEAMGQSLAELIIPERFRDDHHRGLQRFHQTGIPKIMNQRLEMSAVRRNGEEFPIELSIIVLRCAEGYQYSAFVRDITEHKSTLEELRKRDQQITTLLNSTAEGIYGVDLEGRCTFANNTCARLLGYDTPEELFGANMHQLIHHSRIDGTPYPQSECRIYQAFRSSEGVHVDDEHFWRKDGTSFSVEYWSYPVHVEGALGGSVVTFVDTSDRKRREHLQTKKYEELEDRVALHDQELVAMRDRLELALEGANVGLWDWDAVTDEVYFSKTAKTQLGYDADMAWTHFRDWETRLHPDDYEQAMQCLKKYFQDRGDVYQSTFRLRCENGTYRWILSQGHGEFDESGKPLRLIGVHIDIHEQIENEKILEWLNGELSRTVDALHSSNIDLQQFAYVASHDLQTPLRAIANFAQFLQDDYAGKLDATADDYLQRIVQGAHRMQQLIRDLLGYSRVESRAAPFQPTSLNDAFEDALEMLSSSITETGARVTRDELPTIQADKSQMAQLLTNLIGNAVKYHGDKPPEVHVWAEIGDEFYTLFVQDNGIGISPKHHDRVFEIFRRLHTQTAYPGTGIGLAVCRRIVNRHGGDISVKSQEGKGSTFVFTIPVNNSEVEQFDADNPDAIGIVHDKALGDV
ncbi:PAS/PAC sensor signal transduction histidine kinase [Rhodopirellula maiorica SM1]|uniref:histidine kinase n=1 Tax=Rhodopirellula maiorica SM1 TaxID=1265738 RepID=M5RSP8_9BACT|nr:PAS domain S-box protein [Rhodopirellula maiorica]EMI18412.1 PAS/PAC sensor signal transduction histidine kinase [Rhodopirellula maiorica SM1]